MMRALPWPLLAFLLLFGATTFAQESVPRAPQSCEELRDSLKTNLKERERTSGEITKGIRELDRIRKEKMPAKDHGCDRCQAIAGQCSKYGEPVPPVPPIDVCYRVHQNRKCVSRLPLKDMMTVFECWLVKHESRMKKSKKNLSTLEKKLRDLENEAAKLSRRLDVACAGESTPKVEESERDGKRVSPKSDGRKSDAPEPASKAIR